MFSFKKLRIPWRWGRPIAATTAATAVTAIAFATTVWCRPLDTPDYLLPYFLRDNKARFSHYASIRKKNGNRFMTAEDFVCALLATKDTKLEDPDAAKDLAELFAATDANGDGKLSFSEFSFLMMLLTTKPRDFELSFKVLDEEGKGSLTLNQFLNVVSVLSDDDGNAAKKLAGGGILKKLFGTTGLRRCTYSEFISVVEQLQLEVWKAEFLQFDKKRRGYISAEQFGQLIASQMLGSHLPFYLVENLRKLKGAENGVVPFSSWVAFHKIMTWADEIGEVIQLFTSSGLPLRKKDFQHAITAKGLPQLSQSEIHLVYCLFDRDGDGSLQYDEFFSIMKNKMQFHIKERTREKEPFFTRLSTCAAEALF